MTRFQLTPANNPTSNPIVTMLNKNKMPLVLVLLGCASVAFAASPSPYVGEQTREIKALSEGDIDNLRNGRGMGLARPAELNSYPGPRHVLDSAVDLQLTSSQIAALTREFDSMKSAAIPVGEKIIERETALDNLFTGKHATAEAVRALTVEIGQLQGELRAVHLNAHVATVAILTPTQVAKYNDLRGYTSGAPVVHDPSKHNQKS